MRALLGIVLAVLLVGCGNVRFTEPQPADVREEQKIPEELQGIYLGKEKDTLRITPDKIIWKYKNLKSGKISQEVFSLKEEPNANKIVLKKYGDFYIFNTEKVEKGKDGKVLNVWDVYPMQLKGKILTIFYFDVTSQEEEEWLEKNSSKIKVYQEGDKDYSQKNYLVVPKYFKEFLESPVKKKLDTYIKIK